MAVTVKEIYEIAKAKGCTLATGHENLGRIVRYVDCMEIPNMEAWMRPNVIYITTGYVYSENKERLLSLIHSLHEAKAAALAIKSRFIGPYIEDVLKLSEEYQFPIIIMPEELAFVELNYAIMEVLVKSHNNNDRKQHDAKIKKREADKKLFVDMLAGNLVCEEEFSHRADEQKWPKPPYRVMLIEAVPLMDQLNNRSEDETEEQYQKIEQWIREILLEKKYSCVVLSNNSFFPCIIKKDISEPDQQCYEDVRDVLAEKTGLDIIIGISEIMTSYSEFSQAYQSAMDALDIVRSQGIKQKVVCIEKAGYWKLLKEISGQPACKDYVARELNTLIQYDKENDSNLLETLETLVNHLGARNTTSTSLFLHRNTLMYRIKKIENLTGYNLSEPDSILELSLALRLRHFI